MKKKFLQFAFVAAVIIPIAFLLSGCISPRQTTPPPLMNPDLAIQIRQSFANQNYGGGVTFENTSIRRYYGTFKGTSVVRVTSDALGYHQALWYETVAGVTFHYNYGWRISVWRGGNFYNLQQAYDNGFLTKYNLRTIERLHHGTII